MSELCKWCDDWLAIKDGYCTEKCRLAYEVHKVEVASRELPIHKNLHEARAAKAVRVKK